METFSALLDLCAGNSRVTGEFPTQRPVTLSFEFSLIYAWINGWVHNREAGDLRRHCAHYDVTVMSCACRVAIQMVVPDSSSLHGNNFRATLMWRFEVVFVVSLNKLFNKQSNCPWYGSRSQKLQIPETAKKTSCLETMQLVNQRQMINCLKRLNLSIQSWHSHIALFFLSQLHPLEKFHPFLYESQQNMDLMHGSEWN